MVQALVRMISSYGNFNPKIQSMEDTLICQSCAMPMPNEKLMGTEKDGSNSKDYCVHCYKDGQFTVPNLSLDEAEVMLTKIMKARNMHDDVIHLAKQSLPLLKRWKH